MNECKDAVEFLGGGTAIVLHRLSVDEKLIITATATFSSSFTLFFFPFFSFLLFFWGVLFVTIASEQNTFFSLYIA